MRKYQLLLDQGCPFHLQHHVATPVPYTYNLLRWYLPLLYGKINVIGQDQPTCTFWCVSTKYYLVFNLDKNIPGLISRCTIFSLWMCLSAMHISLSTLLASLSSMFIRLFLKICLILPWQHSIWFLLIKTNLQLNAVCSLLSKCCNNALCSYSHLLLRLRLKL